MSTPLEIVKKAYAAWESKDVEALRTLLHPDYRADVPGGMEIVGIEGAEKCLELCPFEQHSENVTYIADGDRVVRMWDFVATAPVEFRMRMAELNVVKDGKVVYNEAFFDSSACPKEVQEMSESAIAPFKKKETATSGTKK